MINIILDSEQERLLQEQLKTGKYKSQNEVVTEALKALAEKQKINPSKQVLTLVSGEPAKQLLEEKIKIMQELKKNDQPNSHRQALAEDFRKLCEETQALQGDNPLTEEEIAEEIAAYRRRETEKSLKLNRTLKDASQQTVKQALDEFNAAVEQFLKETDVTQEELAQALDLS